MIYIICGVIITLFVMYYQALILRKKKRSLWFLLINLLVGWIFALVYIIFIVRSHNDGKLNEIRNNNT